VAGAGVLMFGGAGGQGVTLHARAGEQVGARGGRTPGLSYVETTHSHQLSGGTSGNDFICSVDEVATNPKVTKAIVLEDVAEIRVVEEAAHECVEATTGRAGPGPQVVRPGELAEVLRRALVSRHADEPGRRWDAQVDRMGGRSTDALFSNHE